MAEPATARACPGLSNAAGAHPDHPPASSVLASRCRGFPGPDLCLIDFRSSHNVPTLWVVEGRPRKSARAICDARFQRGASKSVAQPQLPRERQSRLSPDHRSKPFQPAKWPFPRIFAHNTTPVLRPFLRATVKDMATSQRSTYISVRSVKYRCSRRPRKSCWRPASSEAIKKPGTT